MKKVRIIPRLDVKGTNVVKGIQLEGLRVIGKPAELAKKYCDQGADEILYIDIVASLYERNNLIDVIEKTTSSGIFIPITIGGGIRTLEDIKKILRAGADKVAINTAATRKPGFITEAAEMFGSQCIVGAIEAKYKGDGKWEVYIDNGRECTGLDVIEWAKRLVELGAGELLITSVDRDGTKEGYDIDLIKRIAADATVPVVACGGAGSENDVLQCLKETKCDGISFASVLHYNKTTIEYVKGMLLKNDIPIREVNKVANLKHDVNKQKKTVSIIDYNVGNIKSVISAFESVGNPVRLVSTSDGILNSELLVLPGDGAFGYAMKELEKRNLIEPIRQYVELKKPLLGVCLGMQLLMTESEEFGIHKGLNIIEGKVISFTQGTKIADNYYHVPHMGWNTLIRSNGVPWKNSILSYVPDNSEVYFIHSYYIVPKNKKCSLATTYYGGQEICSVIRKGNVFGTQFHPEKSGENGMNMILYFSSL